MRLGDLLPREHVLVPLPGKTLREAVTALIRHLAGLGRVHSPERVEPGAYERRASDAVLVTPDVALPSYRTDAVDDLVIALGRAPAPLAVDSDDAPEAGPRIVALVLAPQDGAALQLRTVSVLTRLFRRRSVVDALLEARSADDILAVRALVDLDVEPGLSVRDVMAQVEAVSPDLPLRDAVALMVRRRLRALPVVGEKQEVLGVLSEWDVIRALVPRGVPGSAGRSAEEATPVQVRDAMTRSVLCVSEDLGLDEAAQTMLNKNVEQLPVVSEGKLSGFLSRGDIIRKLFGR